MIQYDIFEVFPDGSFRWRACVSGNYNKERKLQEFAEISANRFYALDISAGETLPPLLEPGMNAPPKPADGRLRKTG